MVMPHRSLSPLPASAPAAIPSPAAPPAHPPHLSVLDGWRGISILFVLAAHLLPLGPHHYMFNYSVGILGMVVFFNLSGFLITSFLLKDQRVSGFLIRRFCRVLPLAWLYMLIALAIAAAPLATWAAHYLFYANLPPGDGRLNLLTPMTEHLWSLCMEMQFYVGVALLVWVLRARGLLLLPLLALGFTGLRVWDIVTASSVSYYRIDEILAGCTLALAYHGKLGANARGWLARVPQLPVLVLLTWSCMPQGQWLNYLRPYLAALLVGATLVRPDAVLGRALHGRFLIFVAGISYALYVIHPLLMHSWLGDGDGDLMVKYAKRPLLFLVLFLLAWLSTRYYEAWFMALGRRWAGRLAGKPAGASAAKPDDVTLPQP